MRILAWLNRDCTRIYFWGERVKLKVCERYSVCRQIHEVPGVINEIVEVFIFLTCCKRSESLRYSSFVLLLSGFCWATKGSVANTHTLT